MTLIASTYRTFYALIIIFFPVSASAQWINEFHYDNISTDANECIEIAGPAGTDLSGWSIVLYNGPTPYDTDALSGTIPDEGCGYGVVTLCYPTDGIQNGGSDGIALYDGTSVVQFLSYEGVITATSGVANGMTSTNVGVQESNTTTLATESLQLTGSGTSYGDFTWQNPSTSSIGTLNAGQTISPCGSLLTISNISSTTFAVDCATGEAGTIDYVASGTLNPGNIFTVELSDASGSFANPIEIGSIASLSANGTINFEIPQALPSGSGYRIRVVSSDVSVTSADNGVDIDVTLSGTCTGPWITSVIINSCNPTCSEGYNEIVFGSSGDYSFNAITSDFTVSYGTSLPGSTLTDLLNTNPTTTDNMNIAGGCTGAYVDGTGQTIPPNSSFILVNDGICVDALDWSGLCASGPIYVIYTTDPTWLVGGTFKNGNTGGLRYFSSDITTTFGTTFTVNYEYNSTLLQDATLPSADGDFVSWGPTGGTPTYGDNDCILTPILLPIETINFRGENIDRRNILRWETVSEKNSSYFEINQSKNGINWKTIGYVTAAENSQELLHYELTDWEFLPIINYYSLVEYDLDGSSTVHPVIITIDNRQESRGDIIGHYNILGQKIEPSTAGFQLILYSDGSSEKVFKP